MKINKNDNSYILKLYFQSFSDTLFGIEILIFNWYYKMEKSFFVTFGTEYHKQCKLHSE